MLRNRWRKKFHVQYFFFFTCDFHMVDANTYKYMLAELLTFIMQ